MKLDVTVNQFVRATRLEALGEFFENGRQLDLAWTTRHQRDSKPGDVGWVNVLKLRFRYCKVVT